MQSRPLLFIKILAVLIVVAVFGFYVFHQTKVFLFGPEIIVSYPKDGQTLAKFSVTVKGKALNTSRVLVNDYRVLVNEVGHFEKNLILARGYNIIELTVEDKFGRQVEKKLQVVVR